MNLNDYIRQVSREDFGREFRHQAMWNKRLKTTGGRFFPSDGHLDFNPRMLEKFGLDVFRRIVRHELCHYHLYYEKKGYRHGDQDFKNLLKQVDGLRFAPNPQEKTDKKYRYICKNCKQIYQRQRRVNIKKYRCGRCGGQLKQEI